MKKYEIILFETINSKPVEKFILSLSDKTISKVFSRFEVLENFGERLGMPHSRKIVSNIYELRTPGTEAVRLLYTRKSKKIIILHGFKKKRQKLSIKDLTIAQKRLTLI